MNLLHPRSFTKVAAFICLTYVFTQCVNITSSDCCGHKCSTWQEEETGGSMTLMERVRRAKHRTGRPTRSRSKKKEPRQTKTRKWFNRRASLLVCSAYRSWLSALEMTPVCTQAQYTLQRPVGPSRHMLWLVCPGQLLLLDLLLCLFCLMGPRQMNR